MNEHPRFRLQGKESAVVAAYLSGKSTTEIGRMFGVKHPSINQLLERQGVPRRTRSVANMRRQCKRGHLLVAGNLYLTKDGVRSCQACRDAAGRRRRFGLEPDEFERRMQSQEHRCAVCQTVMKRPQVDHDHSCCPAKVTTCGKCVRDLLCRNCNLAVGFVKEDVGIAERLVIYLRKWKLHESSEQQTSTI